MHKVRRNAELAWRWLAGVLLLTTAATQAAPDTGSSPSQRAPVTVGFVRHAQGVWLDATHNTTLATGSEVFENAQVIRQNAADNTASIEIYLLDGKTVVRKCANASCTSAIEIKHPPASGTEALQRLNRLMKELFGPAETEEGAVTFAAVEPATSQWIEASLPGACDTNRSTGKNSSDATPQPNPTQDKPTPGAPGRCTPPIYAAGTMGSGGHIHWIAGWGGPPVTSGLGINPPDSFAATPDAYGIIPQRRIRDLLARLQVIDPDTLLGRVPDSESFSDGSAQPYLTLYKIESEAKSAHEPAVPPVIPICHLVSGSKLDCTTSAPGPGVYATRGFRGLVFSQERIACLEQARAESEATQALFKEWNKAASPEERMENERVSTRYTKDQFSACQAFQPVTPTGRAEPHADAPTSSQMSPVGLTFPSLPGDHPAPAEPADTPSKPR